MTPGELAREASSRARRRISRAISRATNSRQTTYVSDADLERSLRGKAIAEVATRIRSSREPRVIPGLTDLIATTNAVKQIFPDSIEQSCLEAKAILARNIRLFDRAFDLGRKIDWHVDPQTGARWPLVHYTTVPLVMGSGSDVRLVWELNRLHHLVALGRAYLLTNDEQYTEEFLLQLASWYEDNPPNFGVNWTVAMEAGIRAVNIIASFEMFRLSPNLTDKAIELILKMLLAHGRFIRANLEVSYRTPSNHYLSDLIGLFAIGMSLPEFSEAHRWVSFSKRRLLKQMDRQVLSDGVDYEGAIGYHRFVLEIFVLLFANGKFLDGGVDIPVRYWERLVAMFDFVRHYLKPDGTAPMIGDSDDGRLIKFKTRDARDHSYLMSMGAVLLESDAFMQSSQIDEEAFWWFGRDALEAPEALAIGEPADSAAFPEAQIFVQRAETQTGPVQAIIDCGDHGARGRGSHAHSDALSIEVFACGRTFLRDPGTFVYTASEEQRNLFRSTAYHNTVRIDGEEISQINEGELFAFVSNVRPKVNYWESTAKRDVLDAEHYAYRRLASPITHRRIVTLEKREGYWLIQDIFSGEGKHRFEFFFNFDVGLEVTIDATNRAIARDQSAALTIVAACDHTLDTRVESRWVSSAYGTRENSSAIIYALTAEVPLSVSFQLRVTPSPDAK